MKVSEMIEHLGKFNPEAQVFSLVKCTPSSPRISFGSSEGCTPKSCEEVYIYVVEEDESEKEKP
jgi:hypothetical protein